MPEDTFTRLKDICYLDHVGAALYSDLQIDRIMDEYKTILLGNPHSLNPSSRHCSDLIDQTRFRILNHFETDSEEYSVVFTSGATESIKMVAELFDWSGNTGNVGKFAYTEDNHTSVLGMRELIKDGDIHCLSHKEVFRVFEQNSSSIGDVEGNSLFVYPAQCNFSGIKYPLKWIEKVQRGVLNGHFECKSNWYCLLDAATFASTNRLNLSKFKPDFVAISFYKIFGYPTGLGALLVKNSSSHLLKKKYYGGGTILMALSDELYHVKRPVLHERLEDGTANFLSIISIRHGFDMLERISLHNNMMMSEKVFKLTQQFYESLIKLRHGNGKEAVQVYNDTDYKDIETQGNIVNFNMLRDEGQYVGYLEVLNMANLHDIHLRTGCFCNPGACRRHLCLNNEQLRKNYNEGHTCAHNVDLIDGRPTGSVRVSFGFTSTENDVNKLVEMLISCFVSKSTINKRWKSPIIPNGYDNISNIPNYTSDNLSSNLRATAEKSKIQIDRNVTLKEIHIYPIKSCGAYKVSTEWPLTDKGLKYDRDWMIITSTGIPLTQRKQEKMCLIKPQMHLINHTMTLTYNGNRFKGYVCLKNFDGKDIGVMCTSKVCGDRVEAIDCGDEVAEWISQMLQEDSLRLVRLVKRGDKKRRQSDSMVSFANQSQYLLINESSSDWLREYINARSSVELSLDDMVSRFRSNFVVQGELDALSEQSWTEVDIGGVHFKVDGPCRRCQMICIDQSTGKKIKEPLTALSSALNGKITFGIYLSSLEFSKNVKIGDTVLPKISEDFL